MSKSTKKNRGKYKIAPGVDLVNGVKKVLPYPTDRKPAAPTTGSNPHKDMKPLVRMKGAAVKHIAASV